MINFIIKLSYKYKQYVKFLISGGTATFTNLFFLFLFYDVIEIEVVLSATLAFSIAFFVSFYLQKFWTFGDDSREAIKKQLSLYLLVGLVGMGLNALGMHLLVNGLHIWYLLSQAILCVVIACGNFLAYKFLIFKNSIQKKEVKSNETKILIATGIFPPDIGGPATFVKALDDEFKKANIATKIVTYGEAKNGIGPCYVDRRQNVILRYSKYFVAIWKLRNWADVIYAFDISSVGIPCSLVKFLRPHTKLIVRLGGDYQYESAVQKGLYDNTLINYYKDKNFNVREKLIYGLNGIVLSKMDLIIFNSEMLRDIYVNFRGVDKEKTRIIKNITPDLKNVLTKSDSGESVKILFAGRLVAVRNLIRLINAFSAVAEKDWPKKIILEIIGEGPEKEKIISLVKHKNYENIKLLDGLGRSELYKKMANSDIVVLPSLTEINANFITEALLLNKHVVCTKESESYYIHCQSDLVHYVNPTEEKDIILGLDKAISSYLNKNYKFNNGNIVVLCTWKREKVLEEHLKLFADLIK